MAQKKSKKKQMGGATGKPPMTEPRVQVFSMFGGCNFQLSPRDFAYEESDEHEQSDLMPNLMVIQNNALITSNQTIQTRQNLVPLFSAPVGKSFTGIATLVGDRLYAACNDNAIHHGVLPASGAGSLDETVWTLDNDGRYKDGTWTFLGYADDQLVGMTAGKQIWVGDIGEFMLQNARPVPDPTEAIVFGDLAAHGSLTISATPTANEPFRISLRYTLLNKFGPTLPTDPFTFYASKPTTEWSGAAYITISKTAPDGYDLTAVELYYNEGEYQEPAFLTRVGLAPDNGSAKAWSYNWTGYLYDTASWLISNLALPEQNYTAGVPASMMAAHDGQLYFWGGEPAHRIWVGGNPGNRFSVSTGTGGGFVDCEPGTGTVVRNVMKFKTQQGASIVTALCDNPNSHKENRFNLVENTITISNEQSAKGWLAEKISGTVGCKSSRGAVVASEGLYAVSRYGLAVTTLTMEYNSQLQVEYVSDPIEPIFTDQYGDQLSQAALFAVNDVLYMTMGSEDGRLDNVIFCYDIDRKAWWTYTLDTDKPILNMIHIDHEGSREGIGIVTADTVYLLPTTRDSALDVVPLHDVLIESAELTARQPLQSMSHLTQLEFRFDYFIGELVIDVDLIDQFGRTITVSKHVSHDTVKHQLSEYLRVDKVVESYKVTLRGKANMRLTHFLSKSYPKSNRIGLMWGFDDSQSHSAPGSVQRTFADYNDLKEAIIP